MSLKLLRREEQEERQKKMRERLLSMKGMLPGSREQENTLPPSGNKISIIENIKNYKEQKKYEENTKKNKIITTKKEEEEAAKKKQAEKVVAVTEILREQVADCKEDLNKAIYELHAQLFLNSVQRQKMMEIEEKSANALEVLEAKHKKELHAYKKASIEQENMVDKMAEQMQNLQTMALEKIQALELQLDEARKEGSSESVIAV